MAKTIITVKTFTYVVYTDTVCKVTDTETGRELTTAVPGVPNYFSAMGSSVTLSDDAAFIMKPVFKCAPDAMGLLVGGPKLPAGYTKLDFLESTGTQYIDTGVLIDGTSGVLGIFEPVGGTPNGWAISAGTCKYSVSFSPLIRYQDNVGFQYKNIASYPLKDGTWATSGTQVGNLGYKVKEKCRVALNWLNDRQWVLETNAKSIVYSGLPNMSGSIDVLYLFARMYEGEQANREAVRIYKIQISQGEQESNTFIPALDPTGAPCMYDIVSKRPLTNAGSGSFVSGVGSVAQLICVLRQLPVTDEVRELVLSLPAEANTPEIGELMSSAGVNKGWTLTVKEYRAAAAAAVTYSLRRVREVVWCRKVSEEYGGYVDATGNRWQVERCAAVFGPLGQDPAAYGYEPFDSVEQAAEVWELVPYQTPEEENLTAE